MKYAIYARAVLVLTIGCFALPVHGNVSAVPDDPYLWLEEVAGQRPLQWVREQNDRTTAPLTAAPDFQQLESGIRAILDSDARIPMVTKIGPYYYNLWKDAKHERGLFRRTTLEEYRKAQPRWETVLDIDALNAAEKENWVWKQIECLRPEYRRCLIDLSHGGSDASVTREFDLVEKRWVEHGFFRAEAKGELGWIDVDTVYVATDFGPGSLTQSGYPRVVKRWKRGTPLSAATAVYEGQANDLAVGAMHDDTPGHERDFVTRAIAGYRDELYLRSSDGQLAKVDVPDSARKQVHREWLLVQLRDAWTIDGKAYEPGSLLAVRFADFMAGNRKFEVLFTPTVQSSLASATWTRGHLVLSILEDVRSRLTVWTPSGSGWRRSEIAGVPTFGRVAVEPVDAYESDAIWLTTTDFLTPAALSWVEIGERPALMKSAPSFFDATKQTVEQRFVASKDGTRIPYFVVRPRDLKYDGTAPTILYGYGGFEIPQLPGYSGTLGKAWLEKGGVYVVANIRGGGEYGPRWHQAALKANRHKAYEDFAAVAQDLVARKITSPRHLGAQGGSNGGLLTGNMLASYPELFGAIAIQVPLLDMRRYSHLLAGASWIAEYGDPDKAEEWEFIQKFSPYHLFDAQRKYPPVIFTTSTRDDRVHPGHARKLAAKMLASGKEVVYYENIEGGHGGAANNAQAAHMSALVYTFFWQKLAR